MWSQRAARGSLSAAEFEPRRLLRTLSRREEEVVDETPSGVSNSVPPAVLEAEGTGPGSLGGGTSTGAHCSSIKSEGCGRIGGARDARKARTR